MKRTSAVQPRALTRPQIPSQRMRKAAVPDSSLASRQTDHDVIEPRVASTTGRRADRPSLLVGAAALALVASYGLAGSYAAIEIAFNDAPTAPSAP